MSYKMTTREELYLRALNGESVDLPRPHTREERFLAKAAGMDVELPYPRTRLEMLIAGIKGGGSLDPLDNPASAADILSGFEAYSDQGEKIVGNSPAVVLPALTTPAAAANILGGREAYDDRGNVITGRARGVINSALDNPAAASDVAEGKEAYDDRGNVITGTFADRLQELMRGELLTLSVNCNYIKDYLFGEALDKDDPDGVSPAQMIEAVEVAPYQYSTTVYLGSYSFFNCTHLRSFRALINASYGDGWAEWRNEGDGVRGTFRGCTALETVDFNAYSPSIIPAEAFMGCASLTAYPFPDIADTIRESAFEGSGIRSLDSGYAPITLGKRAFAESSLRTVNIKVGSSGINGTVGEEAFKNCLSLTSATIGGSYSGTIEKSAFEGCTALASVSIEGNKTIGNNAFKGCSSLTSFSAQSVAYFGYGCLLDTGLERVDALAASSFRAYYQTSGGSTSTVQRNLEIVNLPNIATCEADCLCRCPNLRAVNLPLCTSINGQAFRFSCGNVNAAVLLQGNRVVGLTSASFIPSTITFYVNDSRYDSYLTATNWVSIASQIKPMSECPAEVLALFE